MKKYLNMIKYETISTFKTRMSYKTNLLSNIVIAAATFFIAYMLNQGSSLMNFYGATEQEKNVLFLIGFLFWQICAIAISFGATIVEGDAIRGTLEQKIQSVFPLTFLLFVKVIISVVANIFCYIVLILTSMVFFNMGWMDSVYILLSFIIIIPSMLGMFGMGLIFSSISLVEKNIGQLITIVQILLLLISNVLNETKNIITNTLPFSKGIEITRLIYMGQEVSWELWVNYLLINFIWFILGKLILSRVILYERKYGSFNTY